MVGTARLALDGTTGKFLDQAGLWLEQDILCPVWSIRDLSSSHRPGAGLCESDQALLSRHFLSWEAGI